MAKIVNKLFPYNTVISSMHYTGETKQLKIIFVNPKVGERDYADVPAETFYKILYESDCKKLLSLYATTVKKKFELIKKP